MLFFDEKKVGSMSIRSEESPYGPDIFFEKIEGEGSSIESISPNSSEKIGQIHDKAIVFTVAVINAVSLNFFVVSKAVKTVFPNVPTHYIGAAMLAQSALTYFFYKNRFERKESFFLTEIEKKVSLICELKAKEKIVWAVREVFQRIARDVGLNFAINILPSFLKVAACTLILAADALKLLSLSHNFYSIEEDKTHLFI